MLPTDRHLIDLFNTITGTSWNALQKEIIEGIHRERAHPSTPDGYPKTTIGGGGGGGNETATSVEAAVIARQQKTRDEHRIEITRAVDAIRNVCDEISRARGALARISKMKSDEELNPEPQCAAMARVGTWEPFHRNHTIDNKIVPLGRWAYDFARAMHRMPTIEECKARAEGRRVRINATEQKWSRAQ